MSINTDINDKLLLAARMLEKAGDIVVSKFGITSRTYEILIHINNGINTTVKLSNMMQSSLANITHKTKLLEENGHIKREVDTNDKRVWHFLVTKKGKKSLETIHLLYEKATEKLYYQFSNTQKLQILDFLQATEKHLSVVLQNNKQITEFVNNLLITERGSGSQVAE